MKTVITNAYINPEGNRLIPQEIRIEEGIITSMETTVSHEGAQVLDGQGATIFPGFVDVHVHLREPGFEAKETLASGTLAAAMGGFTTICPMPNTHPVIDDPEVLDDLNRRIAATAKVKIYPYATLTQGLSSNTVSDLETLAKHGAFAFTNDGLGVQDAGVMYQAMLEAKRLNKAVVAHTEDTSLLFGGVMHEGIQNQKLGLPGMLGLSESTQIARDVLLAKQTGVHYHVCHVSAKESVAVIRAAKKAGIRVSAEVTPHHLLLSEADIIEDDADFKMNPPLRSIEDKQALLAGLLDGTLDFIASDHAPHTKEEKEKGFLNAPFGIIGLETTFPLLYTHYVKTGIVTLHQLVAWLSLKPARCFDLTAGMLAVGQPADITLIDLDKESSIQPPYGSKAENTPFKGWSVWGEVQATWVDGTVVYKRGQYE